MSIILLSESLNILARIELLLIREIDKKYIVKKFLNSFFFFCCKIKYQYNVKIIIN